MDCPGESLVTVMDLLDLDESIIDLGLHRIMNQKSPSKNHLKNVINLLQYKLLINFQEGTECDNENELQFVVKILSSSNNYDIDLVCRIMNTVLSLNPSSLEIKAEHLLQQLFYDVGDIPVEEDTMALVNKLKLVDCILESLILNKQKITLLFLEVPLSHILYSKEQAQKHFLIVTVPKFIETVNGYNILDEIWKLIIKMKSEEHVTLMTLICLSDYFLPLHDKTLYFESDVMLKNVFWEIVLSGLKKSKFRKMSLYLAKRAIDCLHNRNKHVELKNDSGKVILQWNVGDEVKFRDMWDAYFVLVESLEEKQSNIVLPSLQLLEKLVNFGDIWLECVFEMALQHDNISIRKKCLDYRLDHKLTDIDEAIYLLNTLNDIAIYDDVVNWCSLKSKLEIFMLKPENLKHILRVFSTLNWGSIPLYHLSEVFAQIKTDVLLCADEIEIVKIIPEFVNINCNNLSIKKAVLKNLIHFISSSCKNLHWHSFSKMLPSLLLRIKDDADLQVILMLTIETIYLEDRQSLLQYTMSNYLYSDLTLLYLSNNPTFITDYLLILSQKISSIRIIVSRQYASYIDCLREFMCIAFISKKLALKKYIAINKSTEIMMRDSCQTLINYLSKVLCEGRAMRQDEMETFCKCSSYVLNYYGKYNEAKMHLMNLYKMALVAVRTSESHPQVAVLSLSTIRNIIDMELMRSNYQNEIFNLENFLYVLKLSKRKFDGSDEKNDGRLINKYFENVSSLLYNYLKFGQIQLDIQLLYQLMFHVNSILDYGGYGCLQWILKIINCIQNLFTIDHNSEYEKIISRCWKEIEELKSNKEFLPCMKEFIDVLTTNVLLKNSLCHNSLSNYFEKILEYGSLNYMPLYYLSLNIERKTISRNSLLLIPVLSNILLFCSVPKKEISCMDCIIKIISSNMSEESKAKRELCYNFHYEIQNYAVAALLKIKDSHLFDVLQTNIITKIDTVFKNKQRYHRNSESHRMLLLAVRHMLFLSLLSDRIDSITWCINMLSKLPHEPSVKTCLEWYISLYFIEKKQEIRKETCDELNLSSIPLLSQFLILYYAIKHKISTNISSIEEYKYVMEFLLQHSMGQLFNVRLHAQYLAYQLFQMQKFKPHISTYDFTINLIEQTFQESSHEKSFKKINADYFVNEFDVVKCLTPSFIYCFLPKYFDIGKNDILETTHLPNQSDCEEYLRQFPSKKQLVKIWLNTTKIDSSSLEKNINIDFIKKGNEINEESTIIQKKYIPWKNMSEFVSDKTGNFKSIKESKLIVVATLVDKLPNLGGIARTSEVFGVHTYVVNSLKHLQDKQFQGLSLSAEQWINVEEVRPGKPLKEYLLSKKREGYTLVAAEQTSSSKKLNKFTFPEKSLLLLGHEKDGVPCDLLPLMGHCVEIPQKGYIRSLNVHVTAAMFIWEYVRQHLL